jgi:putative methionine-R-sulfoxide reductase with GAF domain
MKNYKLLHIKVSIRTKLIVLFFSIAILPLTLLSYYGYITNIAHLEKMAIAEINDKLDNTKTDLQYFFTKIPNDLKFLANLNELNLYVNPQNTNNKSTNIKDYIEISTYTFFKSRNIYADLRIINNFGDEILHVTKNNNTLVFNENLNDLSSEINIINALNLQKDSISINLSKSKIDYIITLNENSGLLILSIDLNELAKIFPKNYYNFMAYYLVDNNGNFLFNNDREHKHLLENSTELIKILNIANNTIIKSHEVNFIATKIFFLEHQAEYSVTLIEIIHNNEYFKKVNDFKNIFINLILIIILVMLILIHIFTRNLLSPLLKVNKNLKLLAKGYPTEEKIKYIWNDEISEIVGSYHKLQESIKSTIKQADAIANGDYKNEIKLLSKSDKLGNSLTRMTKTLRDITIDNKRQSWLQTGRNKLNECIGGEQDINILAQSIISFLTKYLNAKVGTFYLANTSDNNHTNAYLKLVANYAYNRENLVSEIEFGEGIVGQVAKDKKSILLTKIPAEHITIQSGCGEATPFNIIVIPFLYENIVKGVIEIGSFDEFTTVQQDFLEQSMQSIGIAFNAAVSRNKIRAVFKNNNNFN